MVLFNLIFHFDYSKRQVPIYWALYETYRKGYGPYFKSNYRPIISKRINLN